jgi:hypothetical protein
VETVRGEDAHDQDALMAKPKVKRRKKYPAAVYKNMTLDHLLVFAVRRVLSQREACTFERLVCECYRLFPDKFAFQRYPEWPDAARIDKAWRRCRADKGWLAGSVKEGFRLTRSGEMAAAATQRALEGGAAPGVLRRPGKARERYEAILAYVRQAPEFRRYLEKGLESLSDSELRSFLGGTLETPKRILRHNLNQYSQAATIYRDDGVKPFLNLCRRRLRALKE